MSLFANLRVRIRPQIVTLIERALPGVGKITVQRGQEVNPDEVIGKGSLKSGFRSLNLAKLLSTDPKSTRGYLKRNIGQKIYKGELLAQKKRGFLQKDISVVSPTDGVLDFLNDQTGELRISFLPKNFDFPSAVFGIVEYVDNTLGKVIIRTLADEILGIAGCGFVRDGALAVLGSPGDLITASHLNSELSEHIVVGGSLIYNEAISLATLFGIHGIITGGINAKDYKAMAGGKIIFPAKMSTDIGITMMICEGFGTLPLGFDIFEALQKFNGKFVILDGSRAKLILPTPSFESMTKIRKTKVPFTAPSFTEPIPETEAVEVKTSQSVRVVAPPFMGEQGKIVAVDKSSTVLPSGINTYLVTVETKRRKLRVPYPNIEIIS